MHGVLLAAKVQTRDDDGWSSFQGDAPVRVKVFWIEGKTAQHRANVGVVVNYMAPAKKKKTPPHAKHHVVVEQGYTYAANVGLVHVDGKVPKRARHFDIMQVPLQSFLQVSIPSCQTESKQIVLLVRVLCESNPVHDPKDDQETDKGLDNSDRY